jgi:hypothetical protein
VYGGAKGIKIGFQNSVFSTCSTASANSPFLACLPYGKFISPFGNFFVQKNQFQRLNWTSKNQTPIKLLCLYNPRQVSSENNHCSTFNASPESARYTGVSFF